MKVINIKPFFISIVIIGIIIGIFSCSKGETEVKSKELKVFVKSSTTPINFFKYSLGTINDVSQLGKEPLKITRPIESSVTGIFSVDNSGLDSFNIRNKTKYLEAPIRSYSINKEDLRIEVGSDISADSIFISIIDKTLLSDTSSYLIPLTISSIKSSDKGATISSNLNIIYIAITSP